MDVVAAVARLLSVGAPCADVAALTAGLADVAALRRWLDGVEVEHAAAIVDAARSGAFLTPEHVIAEAQGCDLRQGTRVVERAATAVSMPEVRQALVEGAISGGHVDVLTAALRGLRAPIRPAFRALDGHLAEIARHEPVERFRRRVRLEAERLDTDEGDRLRRQQRAVGLRAWTDDETGMVRLSGQFDPVTGAALLGRLGNAVEALFHGSTPDGCPDDPVAKQSFLRAHALLALTEGRGAASGRPEVIVVVDLPTLESGRHDHTRLDCGVPGLDLSLASVRELCRRALITPALLDDDGVLLRLGRTQRLANRAQRRALRAMYRTCVVPGCAMPTGTCQPHHIHDWHHGGHTDLELLIPLCKHHHDIAHRDGWQFSLGPDRSLTITLADGSTRCTGPPAEQWR